MKLDDIYTIVRGQWWLRDETGMFQKYKIANNIINIGCLSTIKYFLDYISLYKCLLTSGKLLLELNILFYFSFKI